MIMIATISKASSLRLYCLDFATWCQANPDKLHDVDVGGPLWVELIVAE